MRVPVLQQQRPSGRGLRDFAPSCGTAFVTLDQTIDKIRFGFHAFQPAYFVNGVPEAVIAFRVFNQR